MDKDSRDHDDTQSAPPAPGPGERVESWKAIAAYLKRSVTTVQRWEKDEGLPIHRHMHDQRSTPYAYKTELNTWWGNRRPALEAREAVESRARGRRIAVTGTATLAVVLLATAAFVLWRPGHEPALPFEERDWALISAFDNRTGEEVFDGTLEHALAHELTNSLYINVVPLDRVDEVLKRMKLPYETPLTPEVAREVALRDGGIRALITGRAEKLDSTYLLSVALVDPADGVQVASFQEEAAGQEQVIPALRRLSHRVRKGLGERLADVNELNSGQFERVTTPSLRALRLFSEGSRLKERGEFIAAEAALREAIAEDPGFASAHTWLAYALSNQNRHYTEVNEHARRGFELSPGLPDDERYFIEATYYGRVGEFQQARLAYEALLRIRPDHRHAMNNLMGKYRILGEWTELGDLAARRADLHPESLGINAAAAHHLFKAGDVERSREYLERLRALETPESREDAPFAMVTIELYPVREHIAAGETEAALVLLRNLPHFHTDNQGVQDRYLWRLINIYQDLGRLRDVERLLADAIYLDPGYSWRQTMQAHTAALRGDLAAARQYAEQVGPRGSRWGSTYMSDHVDLFVRTGLLDKAREAVSAMEERPEYFQGELALARGLLARGEGRDEEAAGEFQRALAAGGLWVRLTASYHLAGMMETRGDPEAALSVLKPMAGDERQAFLRPLVAYTRDPPAGLSEPWIRAAALRARLMRKTGRVEQAEAVEARLRRRLAVADEDHIIARELRAPGSHMELSQSK